LIHVVIATPINHDHGNQSWAAHSTISERGAEWASSDIPDLGRNPPSRVIRRDQERLTGPVLDAFDAS
jgi:hypothetical protein